MGLRFASGAVVVNKSSTFKAATAARGGRTNDPLPNFGLDQNAFFCDAQTAADAAAEQQVFNTLRVCCQGGLCVVEPGTGRIVPGCIQ